MRFEAAKFGEYRSAKPLFFKHGFLRAELEGRRSKFLVQISRRRVFQHNQLQVALDPESAVPEDRDEVCGLQVPTRQELWEKVKSSPSAAWDLATKALQTSGATLSELPKPDFSGTWQGVLSWFNGWFE